MNGGGYFAEPDGTTALPGSITCIHVLLYAVAGLSLLVTVSALAAYDASTALAGALLWNVLPAALGLIVALRIRKPGRVQFWAVVGSAAYLLWLSASLLGSGDPRGLTSMILPVLLLAAVLRRTSRDHFRARTAPAAGERGAGAVEYAAVIVVAAVVLGGLVAAGIPGKVGSGTSAAVCRVMQSADCGRTEASGPLGENTSDRPGDGGAAPRKDTCHGVWGCAWRTTKDTARGAGSSVVSQVSGVKALVTGNPVTTGKKMTAYVWSKSGGAGWDMAAGCTTGDWSRCRSGASCTAQNLTGPGCVVNDGTFDDGVKGDLANGRYAHGFGRLGTNVATMFLPTKIPGLGRLGKLGKAAEEAGETGSHAPKPKAPVPKPKPWRNPAEWRKGAVFFEDKAAFQKWLEDTFGPRTEKLPRKQRRSLYNYKLISRYKEINEYLRGERRATRAAARDIKNLDEAMEGSPLPKDVVTSRVLGDDAFDRPVSQLEGTVQSNKGYTSVNASQRSVFRPSVIANIVKRGAKPVELHLRVPQGTKGLYPGNLDRGGVYTPNQGDPEIVLQRGLKYRIDHVEKVGGTWEAWGTVVP